MRSKLLKSTVIIGVLLLCFCIVGIVACTPKPNILDEETVAYSDEHTTDLLTNACTEPLTDAPVDETTELSTEEPTEVPTQESEDTVPPIEPGEEETTEKDTEKDNDTVEEPMESIESVIDALSPAHGETVCVANAKVSEYNEKYSVGYGVNYIGTGDIYAPFPLSLTWEDVGADCYRVRLALSSDFADSKVVLTAANTVSFGNPRTGTTYYWQVEALYEDRTDVSAIFVFKTADTPRTVYIEGVTNTRDIGGYAVTASSRIRQGMIFRSGYVHTITESGKYQAREELGIRCELDLRSADEVGGAVVSPLGENVLYYNYHATFYNGIKDPVAQATIADCIKVFADPNNYPALVHCSIGRDRTGTVVMLVLALCGVAEEDIYKDYELSFFCSLGSNDTVENLLGNHLTPTIQYLKSFGKPGDSLKDCVEAYCLKIGVTQAEIDSIRSILIEEIK